MMQLIYNSLRGYFPYATDRRKLWPRVLGWIVAWACWIPLVYVWLNADTVALSLWK